MKAITIRQPYAWAVAAGHKDVENRTRGVSYRGDIAIHAGAAWSREGQDDPRILRAWWGGDYDGTRLIDARDWEHRAIIAVAELWDSHEAGRDDGFKCCDSPWGDLEFAGRATGAHLRLRNVRRLDAAVRCSGQLGLWTVPDDIAEQVTAQLAQVTA